MSRHDHNGRQSDQRGFTILEFIVYIALVGMVLTAAVLFALEFSITQTKAGVSAAAARSAQFAMDRIEAEVMAAESIDVGASTFDAHPGVLTLETASPATDPTIFAVTNGQLTVQQGAGSPVALTEPDVEVADFVLTDLPPHGRSQIVRVRLILRLPASSGLEDIDVEVQVESTFRVMKDDGFTLNDIPATLRGLFMEHAYVAA